MNEITFDKIVDWDNILESYKNTQKGSPKHKYEAIKFKENEIKNLINLRNDILNGTYTHNFYTKFEVYEPKLRTIFAPCYRDKIVHHMIYLILREFYEPKFINDSYSCIRGKGNQRAVKRVQHYMRKICWENPNSKPYVVKSDVSKFFPSIDRNIMKNILQKKIKCELTLNLIYKIIDSSPGDKGLPLGNVTSQILTNIYMNEFDQFVKHYLREKYYIRYADDLFFFTYDKDRSNYIISYIKSFIEDKLNLELSEKKTIKRPVSKGIDGLGFKIFKTHILLKSTAKIKAKKRIKSIPIRLNNGEDKKTISQELNSWFSHVQLANNNNFIRYLIKEHHNILKMKGNKLYVV
ncbi:MAG: reverse transcriptase domain-containing protein [Bacteroidales bacterium]